MRTSSITLELLNFESLVLVAIFLASALICYDDILICCFLRQWLLFPYFSSAKLIFQLFSSLINYDIWLGRICFENQEKLKVCEIISQ